VSVVLDVALPGVVLDGAVLPGVVALCCTGAGLGVAAVAEPVTASAVPSPTVASAAAEMARRIVLRFIRILPSGRLLVDVTDGAFRRLCSR
jgi:hypothetical protein